MDNTIRIIKNDHTAVRCITRRDHRSICEWPHRESAFHRADLEFNGVLLKENDCFLELYLVEKWFNIYEIFDRDDGKLKAWYCNVTKPVRLAKGEIFYDDLALDLLVFPDGRRLVLDEDEFEALNLSEEDQRTARSALQELEELFEGHTPLDVFSLL